MLCVLMLIKLCRDLILAFTSLKGTIIPKGKIVLLLLLLLLLLHTSRKGVEFRKIERFEIDCY